MRRLNAWIEKRIVNRVVRSLLRRGHLGRTYAILETKGRRSGVARRTPVANGLVGDTFWLISAHGPAAQYMKNLRADPEVRIGLPDGRGARWRSGTAVVLKDDDALARHRELGRGRLGYRIDGVLLRATATDPTTVRIDLR